MLDKSILNKERYAKFYDCCNLQDGYGELRKCKIIIRALFQILDVNKIRNRRILDVGFGTGITLTSLAERGVRSYGVEFVESACKRLRKISVDMATAIDISLADICTLPFKDQVFDIIICSHVLEHVENDRLAASEIQRVLKHDGLLFLAVPNEKYRNPNILHFRAYSQNNISSLFSRMRIIQKIDYRSLWDNVILRLGKNIFSDLLTPFFCKLSFVDDFVCRIFNGKESLYILRKKNLYRSISECLSITQLNRFFPDF